MNEKILNSGILAENYQEFLAQAASLEPLAASFNDEVLDRCGLSEIIRAFQGATLSGDFDNANLNLLSTAGRVLITVEDRLRDSSISFVALDTGEGKAGLHSFYGRAADMERAVHAVARGLQRNNWKEFSGLRPNGQLLLNGCIAVG